MQVHQGVGEHREARCVGRAGLDQVDDDDRIGDDRFTVHGDEHDVGDEGVVQFAEGVVGGSRLPRLSGPESAGAVRAATTDSASGAEADHFDRLDGAVAGDDQSRTRPQGVGEAAGGGKGRARRPPVFGGGAGAKASRSKASMPL